MKKVIQLFPILAFMAISQLSICQNAPITNWAFAGIVNGFEGKPNQETYVVSEPDKADPYGRQIERETSVVHKSDQVAPGMYWCWPDEMSF